MAAYITAAYWFTASTSFANPAVTLARAATDTFAGIRPADVPAFLAAQILGALAAAALFRWFAGAHSPGIVAPDPAHVHSPAPAGGARALLTRPALDGDGPALADRRVPPPVEEIR